ncbi:hypothetical protein BK722_12865 [Bacillus thuringiensis serovar finitimus]|nr:hypothetical protein BK722_12865 [Bacillus thuringiensis serovar finitimus]PGZ45703.1 hypothetical protein COE56_25825 [Bacillus anthracis]
MLWFLGYLIIGMILSSIITRKSLVQVLEEHRGDDQKIACAFLVTLFVTCILSLIWPVLFTFWVINMLTKFKK